MTTHSSLRSVSIVTICSFAQLLLQFLFQMVLARQYGTQSEMDAYVAALTLPTIVSAVLIGSLGYAFLPIVVELREQSESDDARQFCTQVGCLIFLISLILSWTGYLNAERLMTLFHPGFSPTQVTLASNLFCILVWLILANSLVGFLHAVHHSDRSFFLPAVSGVLGVGTTLLLLLLVFQRKIEAVAWSLFIGSALCILILLPRFLKQWKFSFKWHEGTTRTLRLLLPLILGSMIYRMDILADNFLASSESGNISHLGYAWRIVYAVMMLTMGSLSTVAFPALASLQAAGNETGFKNEVATMFRLLCVLLVPISLGLLFFSGSLIRDLYERGAFTDADTAQVALILIIYVGAILGGCGKEAAAKIYYAMHDSKTPTIIGVISFLFIGLGLKLWIGQPHRWGVLGIAAATSISYSATFLLMCLVLVRRFDHSLFSGVTLSVTRSLISSVAALLAAWIMLTLVPSGRTMLAGICGMVSYFSFMMLLKDEFALQFWKGLKRCSQEFS